MLLIGLTGTLGAGKGTVVEYLVKEKGFAYASVSEFLAAESLRRGREPDRKARHDVANAYRAQGPMALMEAVYRSLGPAARKVVLEPQHTVAEVRFIQRKGGVVLSVDADLRTRYERIRKRASVKDNVSFEKFKKFQELEMRSDDPDKNNLANAIEAADIHLTNDGTPEELFTQVENALASLKE